MILRTKCSGETQWKQKINILNGRGYIRTRRRQRQFGVGGGEQRIGLCQTIAQTWSFQIKVLNKSKRKDISASWRIWLGGGHISHRTNLRCQRQWIWGYRGSAPPRPSVYGMLNMARMEAAVESCAVSQPHILLTKLHFSSCQDTMDTQTGDKQGMVRGALSKTERGNERRGYWKEEHALDLDNEWTPGLSLELAAMTSQETWGQRWGVGCQHTGIVKSFLQLKATLVSQGREGIVESWNQVSMDNYQCDCRVKI